MSAVVEDNIRRLKRERQGPVCAYLYDLQALRSWVSGITASLPPACRLYYAVKANSEHRILETLRPLVSGFEAASIGEVRRIRAVSRDCPIVFGGPGKTDEEIEGAIQAGVRLLHVESLQELRRVDLAGRRAGRPVAVLLRVNLRGPLPAAKLTMCGAPTQFGIDEEELPAVLRAVRDGLDHVDLKGFHLHSLSNQLDADRHAELVALYLHKAAGWSAEVGRRLEVLNVGGGIGVNYQALDSQFDWPRFRARLARVLEAHAPPGLEILFECGRVITATCGYYAAEVLDLKRNHGTHFAVIRGGTHHFRLPASWQHSHPFRVLDVDPWPYPFERPELTRGHITVAGQLCTPKDVLARDAYVERVRIGDVLVFSHAGAYGWSISHHDFLSHPHPETLYVG
ncbi:type III PLP-dependent enzyme [Sorangium sp. So ce1182]|uniref:type III PLP-dependent enzyme n=1 Tax=Sorangium sp. So ce1182 TaxID=3133334 RepID=UPI003F60C0B7